MSSGARMGAMPSCGAVGPEGLPPSCHCEGFIPLSHERRPADTTHSGGWRPTTRESQAAVLRQRWVEKAVSVCWKCGAGQGGGNTPYLQSFAQGGGPVHFPSPTAPTQEPRPLECSLSYWSPHPVADTAMFPWKPVSFPSRAPS